MTRRYRQPPGEEAAFFSVRRQPSPVPSRRKESAAVAALAADAVLAYVRHEDAALHAVEELALPAVRF